MFRKFTLSLILTACTIAISKVSFAANIIINGASNTNYTLGAGDTLFIGISGNYTGVISGLNSINRVIVVAGGGVFNPSGLNPNNGVVCKMHIYGTFTYSQSLTTNTNFTIDIYAGGLASLADLNTKGRDQVWKNQYDGTMTFSGNVLVNGGTTADDNNVFLNYGTVTASANFQMNSGSAFNNYKNFMVTGDFIANGGMLNNGGKLEVVGKIDLNSGVSTITNYCRMIASGGIEISNGNMYNYSYLWARNNLGLGTITVTSGSLVNVTTLASSGGGYAAIMHGRSLIHTGGTITGSGYLYFYGSTTKTGAGVTGTSGITTDTLKMNDITRVNTTIFYDAQTATVYPNAIYTVWGAPDSVRQYLAGCSLEVVLFEFPLAINWNSFDVSLSNNIPVLNWSAEFTEGTVFEIQRSYDGRNFSSINDLPYEVGQTRYEYKDRMVNTQAPIVYYRIKSNEISGVEKYTQTKIVKFNNKPGSIYTAPNPFTNNFIINYRASERETLTIRMFNVSGQQMLVKNVTVDEGNNNINITEASQLAKGIYVIQVNKGYNMISSGKIIKQ